MKTINEIRASLAEIFNADGINLRMYLGLGESHDRVYQLADFDDGATERVCQQYASSIVQFFQNDALETMRLTDLDHRTDALLLYDLDERPAEFEHLAELSNGVVPALFAFANHNLSSVTSLVIKVSSSLGSVLFFKKFYPVALVKRGQILLVVKDNTRFTTVDQDILKVTAGFELMMLDDEFYINDFAKFEKSFEFDQIAKREIKNVIDTIMGLNLVNDVKGYLAAAEGSKREIIRAGRSQVLNMDTTAIIDFVLAKQHQIGIRVSDGRLVLSSKASVKKLYTLLNDDYLTSELTHVDYETLAKNVIDTVAVID